jgi:hypothetical protein
MLEVDDKVMKQIVDATNPHLRALRESMDMAFGANSRDALDVALGYSLGVIITRSKRRGALLACLETLNFMIAPIGCAMAYDETDDEGDE